MNNSEEDVLEQIRYLQEFKAETAHIEAKAAHLGTPKKYYDTLSSFSNSDGGGTILFGVDEESGFEISGVYNLAQLQSDVAAFCCEKMVPSVRPTMQAIEIDGKHILAVSIREMSEDQKPCFYKEKGQAKGSYIRIGDRDEVMTSYELYALNSYKNHTQEDRRIVPGLFLEDLNDDAIDAYLHKINSRKPRFAKNGKLKSLCLSGIIAREENNHHPTIAGLLVFGEYPQATLPQLFVACSVIPGTKLGDTGEDEQRFIDNRRIEGTIEEMFEETMAFLATNMKTSVVIDPQTGERKDRTEYPLTALREAVANALVHRDYSRETEHIYIKVFMFSDRIEIQSPGKLYGINRVEKLGTDAIMETRNSTIIKLLEDKSSIIENRHSGIPTMRREMARYGLPEPEFVENRDNFKVIFRNAESPTTTTETPPTTTESPTTTTETPPTTTETPTTTTKRCPAVERQREVLLFCKTPKTSQEIREHLNLRNKSYLSRSIISPLIRSGHLAYTKQHVRDKRQKYQTTNKKYQTEDK